MGARRMVGPVPRALLLALVLHLAHACSVGAQEHRDRVLPGCGICYPGGYDVNTVGDVQGVILEIQTPPEGPVRLVVAGEGERWIVLASPTRFWVVTKPDLTPGDSITARGSKSLGADGSLYLVAREIRPRRSTPAAILRDREGAPLWVGIPRGRRPGDGRNGP